MQRTIIMILLSTILLPVSCQAAVPRLFVGVTTDKPVYKQGEPIAMALTVLNQGSKTYEAQFSSSKIYDFYLYDAEERLVWKWSGDKMFAMALINKRLEPKQPLTYVETFNQILLSGKQLEPGKYRLVGEFYMREKQYCSKAVEIEVRK